MGKKIKKYNKKKKIDEVKIPVVVGEIMSLLEEKRVRCVNNIERRFKEYYKINRLAYHRHLKNLIKISHPTNPSVVYHFKSEESTKLFFIYWLFREFSNPNWETEGINIINVLCRLETVYLHKNEWTSFHYWWKDKIIEQNLAYMYKNDHLYLQDIVYQSNKLYQILRGMNFNNYNSLIGKLNKVKNLWEIEAHEQRKQKIQTYNAALKQIPKPKRWSKYLDRWLILKESSNSIYEAYYKLISENPKDKELQKIKPESLNKSMNNYLKYQLLN